MPEPAIYERDAYIHRLVANVVDVGERDSRHYAVLEDSIFYPEGGGQPTDRGTLGGVPVMHVCREDGVVFHFLASPICRGPTEAVLDWDRRFDHMQQHTAQHLLSALALDRLGWATTGFHISDSVSHLDLATSSPSPDALACLAEDAARVIREARPITIRWVEASQLKQLGARSRGLPTKLSGAVRLVEIAGLDLNACGGTHVKSTAELEAVAMLGTCSMHGGTRISFVAGGRLRRRLAAHEHRCTELRTVLGSPDSELLETVQFKLGQIRDLERLVRRREERLSEVLAGDLARRELPAVEAHFPDETAAFLHLLARKLAEMETRAWVFLTASGGPAPAFALVSPSGAAAHLSSVGREVSSALGGRGGGSGRVYQGKATGLENRARVMAILRAANG